jgi:hypothetical protein
MGRPVKHTVEEFNHPVISGKKMFIVQRQFGNDGYATWYKILEILGQSKHHYIDLSDSDQMLYVSSYCGVDSEKLIKIIDLIVSLRKFDQFLWTKQIVFCKDFVKSIKKAYSRRSEDCITYNRLVSMLELNEKPQQQETAIEQPKKATKEPVQKDDVPNEKEVLFDEWWSKYGKKVGKEKSLKLWMKLKIGEIYKCLAVVDDYVLSKPDKQFRKDPATYLHNKSFNDEIIIGNTSKSHLNKGDNTDWNKELLNLQ